MEKGNINQKLAKSLKGSTKKPIHLLEGKPMYKYNTDDCAGKKNGLQKSFIMRSYTGISEYTVHLKTDDGSVAKENNPDNPFVEFAEINHYYEAYRRYESIPLQCEICDVKVNEIEPLLDHFNCGKHQKNMNNPKLKNHINYEEYNRRLELLRKTVDMRRKNIYPCELCSVTFNKRMEYNSHKKSRDHVEELYKSYCAVVVAQEIKKTKHSWKN